MVGDRIRIRPFCEDELDLLEGWMEERERLVGRWQPFDPKQGAQLRAFLSGNLEPRPGGGMFAIEHLESRKPIGQVRYALQRVVPEMVEFYDIGYGIAELEMRGKGYAREACSLLLDYLFAEFPVERVGAFTVTGNVPSIRLLERLGFVHEGTLRRALFFDDIWHDLSLHGILREEWLDRQRNV